eukprot:6289-Eustigmatos_ZCMA.PRE.1
MEQSAGQDVFHHATVSSACLNEFLTEYMIPDSMECTMRHPDTYSDVSIQWIKYVEQQRGC